MDYEGSWSQQTTYSQPHLQLEHEYAYDNNTLQPYSASYSNLNGLASNDYPSAYGNTQQQSDRYTYPVQQQHPYQNSTFSFQAPADPNLIASQYLTSSPPVQEPYPLPSTTNLQQKQPYYQPQVANNTGLAGRSKRPRADHGDEDAKDDMADTGEPPLDQKDKAKPGACQRCKNLKVRCEFKTETDPCKRCLNGGHECITPGRKKRRTPPKREHLLNQIREQAEQIQKLMARLEETNKARLQPSERFSSPSPILSPSLTHSSFSEVPNSGSTVSADANRAVEDWIAKARDSLAEFGGFIGAGLPKSYIVAEDPEDPTISDDDWTDAGDDSTGAKDGDFEIAVVSEDESTTEHPKSVAHKRSFGSSTGSGRHPKKKDSGPSEKLATLPSEAVPFGLMAGLSLRNNKKRGSSSEIEDDPDSGKALGVASEDFFRSSPAPDPRRTRIDVISSQAPHILTRRIITTSEAEELFKIYYDTMNLSLSLLDPDLYTPQRTLTRSSFMFTVICALASRFYTQRPELHVELMRYAQLAAGTALIGGPKNVELCIGYILLSLYPQPTKRWEDERGWLYLGLAIRIAVDLNLHLPNTAKPQNELHAREQLNRTRIWLNCHNLDRSTGSQFGKAPIISNLDYTANHTEDWWRRSEYNMKHFDIHICCYNEELRAMAKFISRIYNDPNHPTGLNREINLEELATETDEELQQIAKKWFAILDQTDMTDEQNCFRTGLLRFAFPYARLVALSFGFQFGKHSTEGENPFFMRCLAAATDVVNVVVKDIARPNHKIYLTRGPDAQRVFLTFAAAFLVKLLQPKFASYLTAEKRFEMVGLVQSSIDLLEDIAVDDRHGPRLYARFLKSLLAKVETPNTKPPTNRAFKMRRPKSSSAEPAAAPVDNHDSPASTRNSMSPQPNYAALSFDQFAPPGGVVDPFAMSASNQNMNSVNMSDLFYPPLPYDNDIMQGMQALADPAWQDMASLPGLNLIAQFQSHGQQPMAYSNYMNS